ncbi:MAG: hypothetical protein PVG41_09705, partial [Desulfobacteraceae bacterium]
EEWIESLHTKAIRSGFKTQCQINGHINVKKNKHSSALFRFVFIGYIICIKQRCSDTSEKRKF